MKRGLVRKFWIGATLLIIVLTAFAAGRNLIHAFKIRSQIRVLEREKALYEEKIARDSALIEQLKQDDFLEQYAREHFHMQRTGEKVYIIKESVSIKTKGLRHVAALSFSSRQRSTPAPKSP